MQLKTIGESLSAIKDIQNVLNNTSLTGKKQNIELAKSLSIYSTEAIKTAVVQENLNKEQIEAILVAKGYQGELLKTTTDEWANAASTAAMATSQSGATASTLGLGNAFKGLGVTLKSAIMNPLTWITTGMVALTTIVHQTNQAIKEVRDRAGELGDSFNNAKSDIEGYKEQIDDLYKTINDSNSSVEEVTEARKNLMSVQDELITKFGTEKGTINNITSAINGQTDAWNRLTDAQWQATKNEFNNGDVWNNIGNWFSGYDDNIDRMVDEMEKSFVDLDNINWFDSNNADLFDALKDAGYIDSQHDILTLEGNLESIYDDILNIQNIAKEYNAPASFLKDITKEANKANETLDSYRGMWDNYILNDRIFEDESLADNWKSINDAYSKYQDAMLSGSESGIENAIISFASSLDSALNNSNADESVQEYFSDMYPTLVAEVEKWKFKTAIIPTFDAANIGGLSSEQILKEIQTDGLQAAEETFNSILEIASEYGIVSGNNTQKVQQLLELLVEWGILQEDIVESARTYSYSIFDQSAFNEEIKSYEEGYSKLVSAQEEWNESKAISASTFADLQENGLLQYLQFTSEGLTINKEKLLENAQACKDKAVADLHVAMTSDMLAIAVGDTSNISQTAQTVIAELGKNTEIAGNQALSSVANWATLGETISTVLSSAGVEGISTDQQKQMSAVYDYYKKMATDISNIDITYKSSGKLKKSAEDSAKTAKEALESTLNLYKAELDAGIIDLDTYLKKCNDLLNDARDKAIVTGKEYWDYQKEVTENQKNIYDKVLSAINRRYDKEIDSIEKVIDGIEKQNDALEKQKSIMDGVINAIIRILDREIESIDDIIDGIEEQNEALEEQQDKYDSALYAISKYLEKQKELVQANIDGVEKENDAIQDEIDGYDKLLNAVTLVMDAKREAIEADKQGIQDRIDALRDENDEAKKAYELEQAKLDLERLRSQRNKKLYVEGQGYIYDVDHKAIREQEDNVADLELDTTISALEKEQELLDDILEQLDETEQKWQDIASVFENNKALDKAKELLGDNFQNIIIEGDESSINDILNSYINAQEKLEENALVIEDYEKRIEELEAIAEKWEASANIKEETENDINASELLGKQWQEDILADKQSTYENFCDNYLAIQSKIEDNTTLIESYNQKVEYYENLKKQWQGITDAYTVAQEDLSLVQMLGANAEADILSGRLDVLENFKNEYLSIQAQIEDNNLLITSYEEKVKYYENLKQQWADIADAYKNAEEDMYLAQVLGTNAEADLLNGRLDVLEDFKKKYAEIEQALVDIAWNSANEQNKALASVGSGSTNGSGNIDLGNGADVPDVPTDSTETNAPSNTRTVYEIIDANGESFGTYNSPEEAHSVAKRLVNSGEAERPYKIGEIDLPELIEKKKGSGGGSISKNTMAQVFHDGIKKGYPDTSMPKDKKVELLEKLATKEISLDSDEVPVIARKGEIFLNSPQQSMLAMNYERLLELTGGIQWNVPVVNTNPFANVNTAERGQTTNVSFGTINMYEVNNVRDFAAELDKYSPNIAVQYNGRHRR